MNALTTLTQRLGRLFLREQGDRQDLLRQALRLETFTIGYNIFEGIVALSAGFLAGSIALVGFGLDSSIETLSAIVVFLRIRAETREADRAELEKIERRAERLVGMTLFALCLYVLVEALSSLLRQEAPTESPIGIALAVLSLIIMPCLAAAKWEAGRQLGSGALIADAKETLVCSYLSFTLLMGLGLNALFGWWWADPVAALVMVPLIFQEAREAWEGEEEMEDDEAGLRGPSDG